MRGHRNLHGIGNVEATVLPSSMVLEPSVPTRLAGTTLRLQSSAQILYAKIAWRMYQAGEITARDAYDMVAASIHDPAALTRACAHTSPRVLWTVSAVIGALPRGWSGNDMKALIQPRHRWSEDGLRKQVLAALRSEPLSDGSGEFGKMISMSKAPQRLRPDEDFARYMIRQPAAARPRQPDAEDVAGVIARKHCAGRKGVWTGRAYWNRSMGNPPGMMASRASGISL